jgi:hypothetical protein
MKKLLLICILITLAGCASNKSLPGVMAFPNVPDNLMVPCPDLTTVDESTTKLSDVITTVSKNYETYYDCKVQVDNWIEWYNTHKSIVDSVK